MLFNGDRGVISTLDDRRVQISFPDTDACGSCGLKIICAPAKPGSRTLTLKNPGDLELGQWVQVAELADLELHLALIQFGLPLLLFLSGLLAAYYLSPMFVCPPELSGLLGGLLGLGFSFPLAKALVKRIADKISERYLRIIACE